MKALFNRIKKLETIITYKPKPVGMLIGFHKHDGKEITGISGILRKEGESIDDLLERAAEDENVFIGITEYRKGGAQGL